LDPEREESGAATVDAAEARLVLRARRGDAAAFEEIVVRHQRQVYATARRIVRRHEVADEVAQEAFLRAYRALASFDLSRPFGPWIRRIARNLALNQVRSPASREAPLPETATPPVAPREDDPLQEALEHEASAVLERALRDLPAEQRAVFALRVFDDLSYREIAQALHIQQGTVMSRLARARERLRVALAGYLGGPAMQDKEVGPA
jgi:RNA polymerase sigma-70 factor (ECF subfamily)